MADISASVGVGGKNDQADVDIVRGLLIRHRQWLAAGLSLSATGPSDTVLEQAIRAFQKDACSMLRPDGRVDPKGFTLSRLNMVSIPKPKHDVFLSVCWARPGPGLLLEDFKAAAKTLGCELAAIQAVAEVEVSSRGAYESDYGRPTILFERHKFRHHSGGKWNKTHSDISGPYAPGSYGKYRDQYPKLYRAAVLDEAAALKSASWGAFQILGENYAAAGFSSVEAFVTAMLDKERKHLDAFVSFIQSNTTLLTAIRDKAWATFARHYNGPKYKENKYDEKLEAAYKKYAPKPAAAGATGTVGKKPLQGAQ